METRLLAWSSESQGKCVQVLLRALRDFNLGKLTVDDTGIFMGLLNDIFPKTLESVPRAIIKDFESHVSLRMGGPHRNPHHPKAWTLFSVAYRSQ